MRRAHLAAPALVVSALALSALSLAAAPLDQSQPAAPSPRPAPAEDRVGFPEGYQSTYQTFFVLDRPDNKQVRVVYANDKAAAGRPGDFPYGSVLVMETYRAREDESGNIVVDDTGRYQRDMLTGIFVMRKEPGFGAAYEANRTGEWEYVAFRPDRTYQTTAPNSAPCAACHTDAGGTRDWIFRGNLFFDHASGAVPSAPPGLASAGRIPIQQYSFLPAEVTVRAGTTVTWSNEDEAVHTVTAVDKSWDSGRLPIGGTFSQTFTDAGEYDFFCTIHPTMKGTISVI
ncbi:MAG TPA: cytochrome P460 family protein [Chloroflexota bacterium]|nr:cytochrome P460 family protein [Chloroflexota bacterium]